MHLDKHAIMLNDLLDAGRLRRAQQLELRRDLARNEEVPAEEFARLNEMGPMPVTLERYVSLRPQRMSARAVAVGTINLRDIAPLRAAMADILVARRATRDDPRSTPPALVLERGLQTQRLA